MASEATTRWYDRETFEIVDKVEKKDGSGLTPCTLRQARPRGLLRSVTTVIKNTTATSHGLMDWIINQYVEACMGNPFDDGDKDAYKKMIEAKANEYRDSAADEGKRIHGEVEEWIKSDCKVMPKEDAVAQKICNQFSSFFTEHGVTNIIPEKPYASVEIGVAGTPDIACETADKDMIIDLKTVDMKGKAVSKMKPYDSWKYQLGGYRLLTGMDGADLWQAVADRGTGEMHFIKYEEIDGEWSEGFMRLVENACLISGYDPRTWEG